jgi:hypothetical protein
VVEGDGTTLLRVEPADGVSCDDVEKLKKRREVSELELDQGEHVQVRWGTVKT